MNPKLKRVITYILFAGIGAFFLYLAFKGQDLNQVVNDILNAKYEWVFIALFFGVLSHFFRAMRWRQMLEPLGYKINIKNSFNGVMIGYFVNFIFPRAGELSRCAIVNRTDKIPVTTLLGTVIAERLTDVIMLFVSVFLAFALQKEVFSQLFTEGPFADQINKIGNNWVLLLAIGVVGLAFFIFLYLRRKKLAKTTIGLKLSGFILGFFDGIKSLTKVKNKPLFILYTLGMWVCYFLLPYFTFFALDATSHLSPLVGVTILAVGTVSIAAPAPGGIGPFHILVRMALVLYGIDSSVAVSYATLAHGAQMIMIFVVGGISFVSALIIERKVNALSKSQE